MSADHVAAVRRWKDRHPSEHAHHSWRNVLKRVYGMTEADYWLRLAKQGGGCAICGERPRRRKLPVDHDHLTNRVRGVLCEKCNKGLGLSADSPERLTRASEYLRGRLW